MPEYNWNTLFIGDFAPTGSEADLYSLFGEFGQILEVKIKRKCSGSKMLVYAFVTFSDEADAQTAMSVMEGQDFHGRKLRIRWAQYSSGSSQTQVNLDGPIVNSVYVRFASKQEGIFVGEASLSDLFSMFGVVTEVTMKESYIDKFTRCQSGYAFVHFLSDDRGVEAALEATARVDNAVYGGVVYNVELGKKLLARFNQRQRLAAMQRQQEQQQAQGFVPGGTPQPFQPLPQHQRHFTPPQAQQLHGFVDALPGHQPQQLDRSGGSPQLGGGFGQAHFSDMSSSAQQLPQQTLTQQQQQRLGHLSSNGSVSSTGSGGSGRAPFVRQHSPQMDQFQQYGQPHSQYLQTQPQYGLQQQTRPLPHQTRQRLPAHQQYQQQYQPPYGLQQQYNQPSQYSPQQQQQPQYGQQQQFQSGDNFNLFAPEFKPAASDNHQLQASPGQHFPQQQQQQQLRTSSPSYQQLSPSQQPLQPSTSFFSAPTTRASSGHGTPVGVHSPLDGSPTSHAHLLHPPSQSFGLRKQMYASQQQQQQQQQQQPHLSVDSDSDDEKALVVPLSGIALAGKGNTGAGDNADALSVHSNTSTSGLFGPGGPLSRQSNSSSPNTSVDGDSTANSIGLRSSFVPKQHIDRNGSENSVRSDLSAPVGAGVSLGGLGVPGKGPQEDILGIDDLQAAVDALGFGTGGKGDENSNSVFFFSTSQSASSPAVGSDSLSELN